MPNDLPQGKTRNDVEREPLADTASAPRPDLVVKEYCLVHSEVFNELDDLRRRGWENPAGDEHFKAQRSRADNANAFGKDIFFQMMCQIGDELHDVTSALSSSSATNSGPTVLDLCMAPGGFAAAVLKENPGARVSGISLPLSQGGHDMLLPGWKTDARIQVRFLDLTMLAAEMGLNSTEIPADHIDAANFLPDRPFNGETFDLIFCDGQVLRTHSRAEYREKREAWRLLTSQLVLAFQRIKQDGKLVMLLHKLDNWGTVLLLYTLGKFASLQLFKPKKKHATRSSFYVIAEHIQTDSEHLRAAVATWKEEWHLATFGSDAEYAEGRNRFAGAVDGVLSEFGAELIKLAEPIWKIQIAALGKASWAK